MNQGVDEETSLLHDIYGIIKPYSAGRFTLRGTQYRFST
jgi:hypothetical protein